MLFYQEAVVLKREKIRNVSLMVCRKNPDKYLRIPLVFAVTISCFHGFLSTFVHYNLFHPIIPISFHMLGWFVIIWKSSGIKVTIFNQPRRNAWKRKMFSLCLFRRKYLPFICCYCFHYFRHLDHFSHMFNSNCCW